MSKNTDRFLLLADELRTLIRDNEDTERLFYERRAAVLADDPMTTIFRRRREIADLLAMTSRKRQSLLRRTPPEPDLLETTAFAEVALRITAHGLGILDNAGLLTPDPLPPDTAFLLTMEFLNACYAPLRSAEVRRADE